MLHETFKDIPGYDSLYAVSNFGRVISRKNGKWGSREKTRTLKPAKESGYLRVALSKDNKLKMFRVHRLVALAFLGPAPEGKSTVNHKNGNKEDNHVNNLEWASNREQNLHRHRVLAKTYVHGSRNGCAKLTDDQVMDARRAYAAGDMSGGELAERYDVSRCTMYKILQGKSWGHLPVVEAPTDIPRKNRERRQRERRDRERSTSENSL